MIPRVFSVLKILEGSVLAIAMYVNGHLRQSMGTYAGVTMLIMIESSLCGALALYVSNTADLKALQPTEYETVKKNEDTDAESGLMLDAGTNSSSSPPHEHAHSIRQGLELSADDYIDDIEEDEDLETNKKSE